ncbi:hypothetical protein BD410DRAFT_728323, partial [Rickenella mellea]
DDELSSDELDLISGVYKVFTGTGLQTSDSSWWPWHSAWERSSLNVGYWSTDCEHWFQNRLEHIRNDTAELRGSTEWVNSLKHMNRKTSRFSKAYERKRRNI